MASRVNEVFSSFTFPLVRFRTAEESVISTS